MRILASEIGIMPETGVIKWFNETLGYGFIQRDDGDDVFVHYTAVQDDSEQRLEEGDIVEFDISEGAKGQMAANVAKM